MPNPVSAEALASNPLFAGLNAADLERLLASFEEVSCSAEAIIFRAGETEPALHLLLDGTVEIVLDVPAGVEKIIATLQSNSVFGESSFFHPAPHSATARAVVASKVLKLSRPEYERLLA